MSAIENILGMLPDRVSSGKKDQIFTPPHIAEEMVDALPEDIWNKDTTFLDICCKSGIFLYKIYQKLMESPSMQADFPDETDRAKHIIHKQLFGISPSTFCQMFSTRTVYGYLDPDSHIISFGDNYNHVLQNSDKRFLYETLKKEFGIMKFGVVIGNPPYNKGMDLDFVDLGYKLSSNITCMITPAKWQTAEADQKISSEMSYGEFRKQLVPHMEQVVFYPNSKEVFDIYQIDGITWFLLDKKYHDKTLVVNKCTSNNTITSESTRCIKNGESLINVWAELYQHVISQNTYSKFRISTLTTKLNGRHQLWCNTQMPGNQATSGDGKALALGKITYIDTKVSRQLRDSDIKLLYSSDDLDECKSIYSWLNTRFTRFWLFCNISKLNNILKLRT